MKELRKPNVEKMENMECYYSYYYENPQYYWRDAMKEMDDAWAVQQEINNRNTSEVASGFFR